MELKIASLGQAIIQAVRPRSILCPLQIGLGIQVHRLFASRNIIDILNKMGISSRYKEVLKYEANAARLVGKERAQSTSHLNGSVQFVADNVDHNTITLTGHGTFHGMGMIAVTTPCPVQRNRRIVPRDAVRMEEVRQLGKVDIFFYR